MKLRLLTALLLTVSQLTILNAPRAVEYSDDTPFVFELTRPSLKIVQFADIHLTYGFDKNDQKTLALISKIIDHEAPDLAVFTGDQTLSITSLRRYRDLIRHMEQIGIPWTFVFGNHDYDFTTQAKILAMIAQEAPTHLAFRAGPNLDGESVGNFVFNYFYNNDPFYNLYFLDSNDELEVRTKDDITRYKYLSPAQVAWYQAKAENDALTNINSAVFMHIPLCNIGSRLMKSEAANLTGTINESVYSQGQDTGFFAAMKAAGMSQAVFVGHDHRNSFVFNYQDILLAYGQLSGYNSYGARQVGARIIEIGAPLAPGAPNVIDTYKIYGDLSYAR